jgi:hypothetical protein
MPELCPAERDTSAIRRNHRCFERQQRAAHHIQKHTMQTANNTTHMHAHPRKHTTTITGTGQGGSSKNTESRKKTNGVHTSTVQSRGLESPNGPNEVARNTDGYGSKHRWLPPIRQTQAPKQRPRKCAQVLGRSVIPKQTCQVCPRQASGAGAELAMLLPLMAFANSI